MSTEPLDAARAIYAEINEQMAGEDVALEQERRRLQALIVAAERLHGARLAHLALQLHAKLRDALFGIATAIPKDARVVTAEIPTVATVSAATVLSNTMSAPKDWCFNDTTHAYERYRPGLGTTPPGEWEHVGDDAAKAIHEAARAAAEGPPADPPALIETPAPTPTPAVAPKKPPRQARSKAQPSGAAPPDEAPPVDPAGPPAEKSADEWSWE